MIAKKKAEPTPGPAGSRGELRRHSEVVPHNLEGDREPRSERGLEQELAWMPRHRLLDRAAEARLGAAYQGACRDLKELVFSSPVAGAALCELIEQLDRGELALALIVDVDAAATEDSTAEESQEERLRLGVRRLVKLQNPRSTSWSSVASERRHKQTLVQVADELHLREDVFQRLARAVKQSDAGEPLRNAILDAEARAHAARDEFVRANVGLVMSIARRYLGRGLALNDLFQEGMLGLMRAIEKFDAERGYRFSTYGSWWIRQAMSRALSNQARTIRVPVHAIELNRKLARARRAVEQESGGQVTTAELAARTGLDERQVETFVDLVKEPLSLDAPAGAEGDVTLGEFVADDRQGPAQEAIQADLAVHLGLLLARLPAREQTILRLRFGLDGRGIRTLREIGEAAGVSRERIRQLEADALSKLKRLAPVMIPGVSDN